MKKLLLLMACIGTHLHATVTVPIIGATDATFPKPIHTKLFIRATGQFVVGLESGAGNLALSVANRANFGDNSIFKGIAIKDPLNAGLGIEFLALAASLGNPTPRLAIVHQRSAGPNLEQVVLATNMIGDPVTKSHIINDASGGLNQNGQFTSGIVGLAANQLFIFPAVKPCGGNFGADCDGGIASVSINQLTQALAQVPAQPGDGGIKAKKLDPTTPQVLINNSPTIIPNTVDMIWDDQLQRLYIGLQLTTAGFSDVGPTCATGTGVCVTGIPGCATGLIYDEDSGECEVCPSGGIFNPINDECELCPPNQQFDITTHQCQLVNCPAGLFFNNDPAVLACITCPPGLYIPFGGNTCTVCPGGQIYNPLIGCTPCPSGTTFSPVIGICVATGSPVNCPSGFGYNNDADACVPILPCEPGFVYNPETLACEPQTLAAFAPLTQEAIPPLLSTPIKQGKPPFSYGGQVGTPSIPTRQDYPMVSRAVASGAKSVVVAQVDSAGDIIFADIAPNSAFDPGDTQEMVGVLSVAPQSLAINKVRVMHTSAGPSYLIINGGNGTISQVGANIYALPLVDLQDPADLAQGTIAKKDSALVDFRFVVPAAVDADMPKSNEPAVLVGTGPLSLPVTGIISDIDVVGDTVYISIDDSPTATSEGGILYSQAMFDQTGKIIRWTPWTKKAFPPYATPNQPLSSAVKLFAVDALTSKVWAVDDLSTSVAQTTWSAPTSTSFMPNASLPAQLNGIITQAATAVLDLDQSTRGFLSNQSRYALFAGSHTVSFARISQSLGAAINSPQTVITDFTLANNFLVTSLPVASGEILALEYARQLTGTSSNYFFAGTQSGLYVFSDSGSGFDVSSMANLNAPPFSNGSWTLAPSLTQAIVDIKTTGNTLYVLTQTPATATTLMSNTLYSIPFLPFAAGMFAPGNISTIAQTGVGAFSSIVTFNSIEIISTTSTGSTEQLVLGTNNGLYRSSRAGGVQAAVSQADANWTLIPSTLFFYNGISAIDNASIPIAAPSTIWPFYIADQSGQGTFDVSVLQQLNGTADAGPFNFVPPLFNSITAATDPLFATLPQIIHFWSDGARRIAAVSNIESSCIPEELLSLPFNTLEWDIENPDEAILVEPTLNNFKAFYWIKQIGVSGLLMVGTNKGVAALG